MTVSEPDLISVLVVEDNLADAELVVEAFETGPRPVEVHIEGDGQAALEFLRAQLDQSGAPKTQLVVMDLNLPRLGGLDTLSELKRDPDLQAIPVVILTTSKSFSEIHQSYARGAAAVLNKPMRLSDHRLMMASLIDFWLGHARLTAEK